MLTRTVRRHERLAGPADIVPHRSIWACSIGYTISPARFEAGGGFCLVTLLDRHISNIFRYGLGKKLER